MHNPQLAKSQGLEPTTTDTIDNLHILRDLITDKADNTVDDKELLYLYNIWYNNEVLLQKLWKFNADTKYIKFWTFPKCTCAKLDNEDNYPYGRYSVNLQCKIHGAK